MVYVLEGTSVALALNAADRIQATLQLPPTAFSYLRSHGELDQEHVGDLARILDRLTTQEDRAAVIRCARGVFWLYGNVFRGLEADAAAWRRCRSGEAARMKAAEHAGAGHRRQRRHRPCAGAGTARPRRERAAGGPRLRRRSSAPRRHSAAARRASTGARPTSRPPRAAHAWSTLRSRWGGAASTCWSTTPGIGDFGMLEERRTMQHRARCSRSTPSRRCSSARALLPHLRRAAAACDPEHRLGVRQHRLSRVRRVLRHQVRAARLHRGAAPRTGRHDGAACTTSRRARRGPA